MSGSQDLRQWVQLELRLSHFARLIIAQKKIIIVIIVNTEKTENVKERILFLHEAYLEPSETSTMEHFC